MRPAPPSSWNQWIAPCRLAVIWCVLPTPSGENAFPLDRSGSEFNQTPLLPTKSGSPSPLMSVKATCSSSTPNETPTPSPPWGSQTGGPAPTNALSPPSIELVAPRPSRPSAGRLHSVGAEKT
ncbi:hypothetical protein WME89_19585 [Sorangium sp. So ce321]|uniref:hypothetical protein n=1 Tax=Sorangium sp. So ce321 TaxID=3133300 RepID=UPI003F6111F2